MKSPAQEADARESERWFKLALAHAPVTVAAQDKNLRFIWAYNQRSVPAAEVIGKTDADVFTPEDVAQLVPLKRKVLKTGRGVHERLWLHRKNGPMYLDVFLEPLLDGTGKTAGVVITTMDLTEQKQAEDDLQEMALFPTQNPQPVMRVNMQGIILFANEAGAALRLAWGGRRAQCVPEAIVGAVSRAIESGQPQEIEAEYGGVTYLITMAPIVGKKYAHVYAKDITGRKEAEDRLKLEVAERTQAQDLLAEANRRIATILETIADGFYALDREMRFTLVNDAAVAYFGKTRDEMLGRRLFDVFPAARGTDFERQVRDAIVGGKASHFEWPSLISNAVVDMHVYPGVGTTTVLFTDITERVRLAEALKLSEQREAAFAAATFEGIVLSENGIIKDCNEQFAQLVGWTIEELKGRRVPEIVAPEDLERIAANIFEGRDSITEHAMLRKDGSRIIVEAHGRPIVGSEPHGRITAVRDITERKRREDELRQLNRVLAAHSRSSAAMARAEEEAPYLNEVCRIIDEECGHAMVWIGYAENDAGKSVRPVAHAGFDQGYLDNLRISWADNERGRGPTGTAIRTGKPSGCEDMLADPRFAPWREEALKRGYRSSLVLPLLAEGRAFGAVTIYDRKPGAFSPAEVELLTGLASDLSYGISSLRLRQAHRESEEAARRGQELLSAVLEGTMDPIYVKDPDSRILMANPALARVVGKDLNEIIGKTDGEYWGDAEVGRILHEHDLDVMESGRSQTWEETVPTPDGPRTFLSSKAPLRDADGRITGTIGISRDITDRKKAEEEGRRQNEILEQRVRDRTAELVAANARLREEVAGRLRLVAAVEQAEEGMALTEPGGVVGYVNPAFERITGSARKDLIGQNYFDRLIESGVEKLSRSVREAVEKGGSWTGRVTRMGRDGEMREVDIAISALREPSGEAAFNLVVERDVTSDVRLQEQLRQMQKMEALGTLAGGIAHDFNNILNPIFINAELALEDTPPDSPVRRNLEITLKAAERARDLVKQIITFSRQRERGRVPLLVAPVVKETIKFLRASLPRTIDIRELIEDEGGTILADPTQVRQVLMNLASNAAYAMRDQPGTLTIRLSRTELAPELAARHGDLKPGPYVLLEITDTGTGMTRAVMDRVFDPFFTTKRPGEGTGMGLAMVHGIVRDSGGAITVSSRVGRGSTFTIHFPRIEADAPTEEVPQALVLTGSERILLVDDEPVQVQSFQAMLERLGYRVVSTTDGREALTLFRKGPNLFDLVITDQAMPQITGMDLAKEILRTRPGMPIILCTGYSDRIDAQGAREAGIRRYVLKPFSLQEISEAVRRALDATGEPS